MKASIKRVGLAVWLLTSGPVLAQKPAASPVVVRPDTAGQNDNSPLRVRYPDPDRTNDLRHARDYQYDRDATPPKNLLARLWNWFWDKVRRLMRSKTYRNVGQYIVLAVIAGLVIWLLQKAQVLNFLFPKTAGSAPLDYENLSENIHEISFGDRIEEAVDARNYRLAVRLLYLQTLKQLTDQGLINWQPDKTNRQYVQELANTPYRADFEELTTRFEFIWYGDFPVNEVQFLPVQDAFSRFGKHTLNPLARHTQA